MNTKSNILIVLVVHTHNGRLVTIEETRKLLGNPELSDEEATEIRDGYRFLAEVIFEKQLTEWKARKSKLPFVGTNN